jgi:hypothetical protein
MAADFDPDGVSSTDTGDYGLLRPQESWDDGELDEDDVEAGYSPANRASGSLAWGVTAREAASHESLDQRLAHEEPDTWVTQDDGDGLGDTSDTDGELIDDQVGAVRAGRLLAYDINRDDAGSDYWAHDVGIDAAGASAEEAAVHVIPDDDELPRPQ